MYNCRCIVALTLCAALSSAASAVELDLQFTLVSSGTPGLVDVRHAGDGSNRLYLVQQFGAVQMLEDGVLSPEPFLNISDRVGALAQEQGLLSIAFPPDFNERLRVYAYFTNRQGNSELMRFRVDPDTRRALPQTGELILAFNQPFDNHNGGQLAFGPDGYLYLSTGDGGDRNDPLDAAQSNNTLLGKILRIDPESVPSGYAIPPDNPYAVGGGRPEIWALGLRNPWRISFDSETGDLYIADVGQDFLEEINFQPAGSAGGQNYGWARCEGSRIRPGALPTPCPLAGSILPVTEYGRMDGISVTGGYVYRGHRYPRMRGLYFFGDFGSGKIWSLVRKEGQWQRTEHTRQPFALTTFGSDEQGNLYVADGFLGRLYLVSDGPPVSGLSVQPGHSGNWYNPEESGHGFLVEILEEGRALVWWFTFDATGAPAWIGGVGSIEGDTLVIPALTVSGGRFPPFFDPEQIALEPWGEIRLRFEDCQRARVDWSPDQSGYTAGGQDLIRLTQLAGLSCEPEGQEQLSR